MTVTVLLPHGVIGSTRAFEVLGPGSNPGGVAKFTNEEDIMKLHIVLPSGHVAVIGTMFPVHKDTMKMYIQKYPLSWVSV